MKKKFGCQITIVCIFAMLNLTNFALADAFFHQYFENFWTFIYTQYFWYGSIRSNVWPDIIGKVSDFGFYGFRRFCGIRAYRILPNLRVSWNSRSLQNIMYPKYVKFHFYRACVCTQFFFINGFYWPILFVDSSNDFL